MSSTSSHIADIRKDYRLAALDESVAGQEPLSFFRHWFDEAEKAQIDEVNAMTLATVDEHGYPHARIVLLKGLDEGFVFFTNYDSAKGRQLATRPSVAVVFFWKELERQVRIEGVVEKTAITESDAYFNSRPTGSRIGAWASPQSAVIPNRQILEELSLQYETEFQGVPIPRPEHWGGYRILPQRIEFWQGRSNRLHDRIVFEKEGQSSWSKYRLAP